MAQRYCKSCGDKLVVGVNCKAGHADFCDKPECQEERKKYRKEAQKIACRKSRAKTSQARRRQNVKYCRCCGDPLIWHEDDGEVNAKTSSSKWCMKPECVEHRRKYKARQVKDWHVTHGKAKQSSSRQKTINATSQKYKNTAWTKHKIDKCEGCGRRKEVNRFKMCLTCYKLRSELNIDGDFLFAW